MLLPRCGGVGRVSGCGCGHVESGEEHHRARPRHPAHFAAHLPTPLLLPFTHRNGPYMLLENLAL
jgi:hypothetical protein